jgi:hypothetical protein
MSGVDPLRIVFLLAVLILLVALNRGMFERLGVSGTLRLVLIWASIFVGLVLLASIIGVPERFLR